MAQQQGNRQTATAYVLRGLDAGGKAFFYTGKAGVGWVLPDPFTAFWYSSLDAARNKAKLFNGRVSLTGLWFVAVAV